MTDDSNFAQRILAEMQQKTLPTLSKVSSGVWQAGGRVLCKALFAGELISSDIPMYLDGEDNPIKTHDDDKIADILVQGERKDKLAHFLDMLSYEIPFRAFADFPDNEAALKIVVNDLAFRIDGILEQEGNKPSTAKPYKDLDEVHDMLDEMEEQMDDGTYNHPQPSQTSVITAKQVISAMEEKARRPFA